MVKKAYNLHDMTQFWKQNLYKNNVPATNITSYDYKNLSITVDGRPDEAQAFNPDGSDDKPFSNIVEAVLYACTQKKYDKINIECLYTYGNSYVYVATNKTLNIISKASDGTYIGGLQVDGGIVTLQDILFWNTLASDTPTKKSGSAHYNANGIDENSENYELYVRDAVINLAGCTFRTGKPTGIYARRVFINNDGATYGSGVSNDINTALVNSSGTVVGY